MNNFRIPILLAWLISWVATVGSLYFSEIMKLPPCVLCWYQRICMYPLVIILLVGIVIHDAKVIIYALPFAALGWVIAFYHTLLYYGILPESTAPCSEGISCTTKQIMFADVISIPLMSLCAFTIILGCLIVAKIRNNQQVV